MMLIRTILYQNFWASKTTSYSYIPCKFSFPELSAIVVSFEVMQSLQV